MSRARVALSDFRISGFRSCKRTSLSLEPDVTTLIGPNGAGKTNVLEALRLISHDVGKRFFSGDSDAFNRRCRIEAKFVVRKRIVGYRTTLLLAASEKNAERITRQEEEWSLTKGTTAAEWNRIEFMNTPSARLRVGHAALRGATKVRFHRGIFAISKTKRGIELNPLSPEDRSTIEAIQRYRSNIQYYSASRFTNPAICPTSFDVNEKGELGNTLRLRNSPHLKFLYDLYISHRDNQEQYEQYMGIVGKGGVALVRKITWKTYNFSTWTSEVKSGGKLERLKEKRKLIIPTVTVRSDELSFNQLSEGTFRALALMFYIIQGGDNTLLLEEPEVCVHHGLLNSLIEVIKEFSRTRQTILSTHSDLVIDAMQPGNVRLVRDQLKRGTTVESISDVLSARNFGALKEFLQTSGSLGDYWKAGGIPT
jgi:ABC-type Mn2+/Zn2+ transport system ATPase subunit